MAKKTPVGKKPALKSVVDSPKALTQVEFERMERYRLLKEMRALENKNLNLRIALIEAQKKVVATSFEKEAVAIISEQNALRVKQDAEENERKELMAAVRDRLQIGDKPFGYNPDTLEIVFD